MEVMDIESTMLYNVVVIEFMLNEGSITGRISR